MAPRCKSLRETAAALHRNIKNHATVYQQDVREAGD